MSNVAVDEIKKLISGIVDSEPARIESAGWWQKPLVATAPIDRRFDVLADIAADDHLHPHDLLPTARSIVVFYIPFTKTLVKENKQGDRPCRDWGVAYVQTNNLIERASRSLEAFFADMGCQSGLTPATHNFDEKKLTARWSHKHLAHLVGLGRFGTHHLLITPAGCTGRLGSLVTEAEVEEQALIETEEACLLKAGRQCGKCIQVCPVQALGQDSFDRRRCWDRLNENRDTLDCFSDLPETTHVCGKCAAIVPCSFNNPVASL